eukprot:m.85537 g.85537  ORF g.85537 m.85537 type:complete len:69 (-) comp9634_c0_seq2:265-471(-)
MPGATYSCDAVLCQNARRDFNNHGTDVQQGEDAVCAVSAATVTRTFKTESHTPHTSCSSTVRLRVLSC